MTTIIGLIDEASAWLRGKGTDQWATPWPNREARDERVFRGLRTGKTWVVEDEYSEPVATITCKQYGNENLWDAKARAHRAVYVSRLIVTRDRDGHGIGAALIDWAGQRGVRDWNAQWIRIDVWTTNTALHNYYKKLGFKYCGIAKAAARNHYPSAARFEKPTSKVDDQAAGRFTTPQADLVAVEKGCPAGAF
jgi:GNAT superfamily N-acetyltransferase